MKRIRILHETEYQYRQPVTFGPHRALMRPREGHDLHIARARVSIVPRATVRWLRDAYDNCIAIFTPRAGCYQPVGRQLGIRMPKLLLELYLATEVR
jgi:Bacterial transglutaminase-like N-terminal region